MDLTMPQMNGEQAYAELRRIRPEVGVVLMSGFNEQDATSRFTGKGLANFIQKPFQFDDLSKAIQEVMPAAPESS
jgi:DNA-binding NtrC family response regulator